MCRTMDINNMEVRMYLSYYSFCLYPFYSHHVFIRAFIAQFRKFSWGNVFNSLA